MVILFISLDSSAKLIVNYQIKEIKTHLFILDLKFDNN